MGRSLFVLLSVTCYVNVGVNSISGVGAAAVINLHSSSLDGSDGRGEAYTMIADGTMQQLHILFAAAHNY